MSQVINSHLHLIKNLPFFHNIFQDGFILVANKRFKNLKDLLVLGDPCNIKHDLTDIARHQYKHEVSYSCDNFVASQSYVISSATGRKSR